MTSQLHPPSTRARAQQAIELAARWQRRAAKLRSSHERQFYARVQAMVTNPENKVFLTKLMDRAFRPKSSKRTGQLIDQVIENHPTQGLFGGVERGLMGAYSTLGRHLPGLAVPAIISKIRMDTADVILPGERSELNDYLAKRREEGTKVNLNIIGEAMLGEEEARTRIEEYKEVLENPAVNYISIKISTIYSQISSLAFEQTVDKVAERLSELYRHAKAHTWTDPDTGAERYKFINLDMEEYRDLELTVAIFQRALDHPEFLDLPAGIVLQAYLPDSPIFQRRLTEWAMDRVARGGAPIKVRIVKGANMDMEHTESSIRDWPRAPFEIKIDTDANYKKMLLYGTQPEHARAVHLGIASHNLFELAFAYLLVKENGIEDQVVFEMLEGMADGTRRAIAEAGMPVLLYAPVAVRDKFINAIAYFVRRLDENTAPDNFLTHSFGLEPDTEAWDELRDAFLASVEHIDDVFEGPHRLQDREAEAAADPDDQPEEVATVFENTPDTDFTLPANRRWAAAIREKWMNPTRPEVIPLVLGGERFSPDRPAHTIIDKNRYADKITIATYHRANSTDVERALETAKRDVSGWNQTTPEHRHRILRHVARLFSKHRGDLIGVAAAEVGKLFTETDVEVSEAIDFANYYPHSIEQLMQREHLKFTPRGVGLVIPPWNFPIAIPAGGVLASLAAGNNTIIKPSSEAVYCTWEFCKLMWAAGVPETALQFVPCSGASEGSKMATDPRVDYVILTGGTDTGLALLDAKPSLRLFAETGGKNATIVTAAADRDQAIKNVLHSAFSNSGQKCSATSLLVLEKEVYHDKAFRQTLADAVRSLKVGSAWDFSTKVGPMATRVGGDLGLALEEIQPGEEWLVEPKTDPNNPYVLTPGIKLGVRPGNFTHCTELFGPVLSVMEAEDLAEAVDIVNQTGFGLTSGIESLDETEIEYWTRHIRAGNLYINRVTTGAIVQRQPFGGMGKSAIGPGIKVGGPNYVQLFMDKEEVGLPATGARSQVEGERSKRLGGTIDSLTSLSETQRTRVRAALTSQDYEWTHHFRAEPDHYELRGEENFLRYLPLKSVLIVWSEGDREDDVLITTLAALRTGTRVHLCATTPELAKRLNELSALLRWQAVVVPYPEQLPAATYERIRFVGAHSVGRDWRAQAAELGYYIASDPVLADGRLELLNYTKEQSISYAYHRFGNISGWASLRGVKG